MKSGVMEYWNGGNSESIAILSRLQSNQQQRRDVKPSKKAADARRAKSGERRRTLMYVAATADKRTLRQCSGQSTDEPF
jgi:hypothetical protein